MHIRTICGSFRRRVWHPCHTHAALRIPSTEPTLSLFAQVLPQNSQNTQKLQAENILPQISQMHTDFSSPPVVSVCSANSVGRWFGGYVGFSHGFHRIHRSFWRRRVSHGFHRCAQMVRLRRVLWKDSFVAAWVWQGCHTLLICAYPCNLWENTLRQKLLWVLWLLWEDSLVAT